MAEANKRIAIHAPIEHVYDWIANFDMYDRLYGPARTPMNRVPLPIEVQNVEDDGERKIVYFSTGEPDDMPILERIQFSSDDPLAHSLAYTGARPTRLQWTLDRGWDILEHRGSWTLERTAPDKTQVSYEIHVEARESASLVAKGLVDLADGLLLRLKHFAERSFG
jgi:hypothetical protein